MGGDIKNNRFDVVVLGAGIAGLVCAYRLQQEGKRVCVLEARDRVGGRILTKRVKDPTGTQLTVELGAEWIGEDQHSIIDLCKEMKLDLLDHHEPQDVYIEGVYYPESTRHYKQTWMKKVRGYLNHLNNNGEIDEFESLDGIDLESFLRLSGVSEHDLQAIRLTEGTQHGTDIKNVSAYVALYRHFSLNPRKTGGDDYRIDGGNDRLPLAIFSRLRPGTVKLAKPVTSVVQSMQEVDIYTEDGEKFTANAIVCTLPASQVLNIDWQPLLPAEKIGGLSSIHYGDIVKTAFVFNERFWSRERYGVFTDLPPCQIFHATAGQRGKHGVLMSYAYGSYTAAFTDLREFEQLGELLKAMRLPLAHSRYFDQSFSHKWSEDEWSGGAFAHFGPKQWFEARPTLRSEHGRVFFAGEHLAEDQGYMNGAIESAEEAVVQLLDAD